MITVISFSLIGAITGIIIGKKLRETAEGGFVLLVMGAIVGMFIAFFIGESLPMEYALVSETELVILKDNITVEGDFFLGCGSIESELYYFFYKKDEDGKIRARKLSADKVSIVERDMKGGMLRKYQRKFKNNKHNLWAINVYKGKYEIHIPTGSIINDFKLDLE